MLRVGSVIDTKKDAKPREKKESIFDFQIVFKQKEESKPNRESKQKPESPRHEKKVGPIGLLDAVIEML